MFDLFYNTELAFLQWEKKAKKLKINRNREKRKIERRRREGGGAHQEN